LVRVSTLHDEASVDRDESPVLPPLTAAIDTRANI
jgi:hypothetical protein